MEADTLLSSDPTQCEVVGNAAVHIFSFSAFIDCDNVRAPARMPSKLAIASR